MMAWEKADVRSKEFTKDKSQFIFIFLKTTLPEY
jgi:hypothetical protein